MRIQATHIIFILFLLCTSQLYAQNPVANFTADFTTVCNPHCINFTSTSTGNPTSYSWNFGNGTTSNQQNPSVCYTSPGNYTVTLTVNNASGSNTKTVTNYITVLPGPNVNFSAGITASCPPLSTGFNNTTTSSVPGSISYSWQFGDGSPLVTTQNPSHTYHASGLYNVVLTATDAQGCQSSLVRSSYINVYTPPVINFSAQTNQCDVPAHVQFTPNINGNGPYSYQWTFGDGGTSNTSNPMHIYNTPGVYTVRLIVTDANGCRDTLAKNNYMSIGDLVPGFTATAGCEGTPLLFTNTSNLMDSVLWRFGDGSTDTAINPSHIYTGSGVFNVKLYVYYKTCIDSVTQSVTVHPKPNAAYSFSPSEPCPPPSTIQFTNQSTGAVAYNWFFGDGGTSNATNPTHNYSYDTAFFPKLIAVSNMGCRDTALADTIINYYMLFNAYSPDVYKCLNDTVRFRYSARSFNYFVYPNPFIAYPYPITSFYWDFGDGTTSTLDTPRHVYPARGIYRASLTITTSNGCTATDSFNVLVGNKPTAGFTFSPDTVCNHGTITLVNTSTGATHYMWDMGNGGSYADTSGGAIPYTYTASGIDTIILYAFDYQCADTFMADRAIVVHPPTSIWEAQYSCESPLTVRFFDTLSHEPTSHWWSFGDGQTSTATNPVHTYPSLGAYVVSLYTYNSIYGCTDTMTKTITLIDPVLSFSASDTAICEGDSIIFTPSYTTSPLLGLYHWRFNNFERPYPFTSSPDSNSSTGPWGYQFNEKGIYTVIIIAADQYECMDTFSRTILVAKPEAGFRASPPYGCSPATIQFTDTSTNVPGAFQIIREWDFGNGTTTVNAPNVSNLYNTAGLYDVQLIVTDNIGCSDTIKKQQYVDIRDPIPAFTCNDSNVCIGQLVTFTDRTTGSSAYQTIWYFGDGTSDTARNPVHAYNQTGVYNVKLVIIDSIGCHDSLIKQGYIHVSKPDAKFILSDSFAICPPLNVIFTNISTGALMYSWDMGNGTASALQNPTASYITPGVYTIRLIAISVENCRDTAYGQVRVLGYSGALSYSPLEGCAPMKVNFKAQLYNIPSVIWDFSDGVTQAANGMDTTSHIYALPGAYLPKLVLSDGSGCQSSSSGLDTIKVDGIHAGFISSPQCINTPVTFTDTTFSYFSNVSARQWDFNNGQYSFTNANPNITFNTAGNYPVKLVATNANGCTDSITTTFTIHNLPNIVAVSDTSICDGDAAQLHATGGVSYVWSPPATLSCTNCQNPMATPTQTTSYFVSGTDANGCVNKDTTRVTIQYVTTSTTGKGGEICKDSIFQLNAYGAHRYQWTPEQSLDNPNVSNPVATPSQTTVYTVIAWEGTCPPDTNTVRVLVHPRPSVDAGDDITIVAGSSAMLQARGTLIETFLWSPGNSLSCESCQNPTASPKATTQYKLTVTSMFGCKAYDSVTVNVLCDQSQLFIPNTFSPNGDGQNDVFYPRGLGLKTISSFRIYNRWGELLFEKRGIQLNDRNNGWDGTFRGNLLNPDVFVYIIDGICDSDAPMSWKGDITLIR